MKKLFLTIAFLAVFLSAHIGVFASPETLSVDAAGNSTGLVVVTKPKNQKESTFDEAYTISGYGKGGTVVTLYRYNPDTNLYQKFYTEVKMADSKGGEQVIRRASETTIGTSGLFINTIVLNQGDNTVIVRAENDDKVQLMKLDIKKYNYTIIDLIKSLRD